MTGIATNGSQYENRRPRSSAFAWLPRPCDAPLWFVFNVLMVSLVAAFVYFGLYSFSEEAARVFVGNAVLLIITAGFLATTLAMVLGHARYLTQGDRRFSLQGIAGVILVLAVLTVVGYAMSDTSQPEPRYGLLMHFGVQVIVAIAVVYYCSQLQSDLFYGLYEITVHAGLERLAELDEAKASRADERAWLEYVLNRRREEVREFQYRYDRHLAGLREIGESGGDGMTNDTGDQ
jgi:hypothetical protein